MRLPVLALLGVLALQPAATAQHAGVTQLSDGQVRHALTLALRNIHRALCGEKNCAVATADEFQTPPISLEQARAAIGAGVLSGTAQWCGLDWQQKLFLPAMDRFAKDTSPTERQLALFALLHGIYQGQTNAELTPRGPCPEDVKASIEKRMADSPS